MKMYIFRCVPLHLYCPLPLPFLQGPAASLPPESGGGAGWQVDVQPAGRAQGVAAALSRRSAGQLNQRQPQHQLHLISGPRQHRAWLRLRICVSFRVNNDGHNKEDFYWAIQAGLLTPLTFARHRLSPSAAFTSGAYFLHNGRR